MNRETVVVEGRPVTLRVLEELAAELHRARESFPLPFHSSHEGHSLIREETDKLWRLVMLDKHQLPSDTFCTLNKTFRDHMRIECIQIAAMAIRFIEDLCDDPPSVGGEGSSDE